MNALQASDYTIWIMLTISLSAKVLHISFARKDEAAGNSEPPQGLPASKPVGGSELSARESQMLHSVGTSMFSEEISSSRAESPKRIASLSSTATGLLQSFITSIAGSVGHKSLP